ncbi:MAG: prepilin-type N-terminal cleavage/methylation domain-containing protein [Armatimonadetes bacterium]|nr:prepilin-type N-terminal cleavage/methylation domain-containing protein [Armatimonadota bacterium]
MRRPKPLGRSGVTLLELIVVLAILVTLTAAIGYAFAAGIDIQRLHTERSAALDRAGAMEERIRELLQGAGLSDAPEDAATYFIGQAETEDDTGELGADRLTFTTVAPDVPIAARMSQDDFEAQHLARGPVGGIAEVSLGITPVGADSEGTGLFERVQRPSDGDPAQGGLERLLAPEVERIGFQFWDGLEWVDTWDTTTGARRLPAAVKVNYALTGAAEDEIRVLIVPLPASDVDERNPAAGGGL